MGGPAVADKGMLDVARAVSVDAKLLREWIFDALSRYDYFTCEVEGEGVQWLWLRSNFFPILEKLP